MGDEAAQGARPMSTGRGCIVGALVALAVVVVLALPRQQPRAEAAPIGALKTLNSAQTLYREGDKDANGTLDYGSLGDLSDATLVDGVLGSGRKRGYRFTCEPSSMTPEFLWFATASPEDPSAGDRYFATNHSGVIYYSMRGSFSCDASCALPGPGSPPDALPVGK